MTKTPAQLDREIAEVLSRSPSDKRPLYGHTSEATAYVVDDYPYGFSQRTKIRFWLENKANKGWRFVSQTLNPKTNRWNKPKASTYSDWAGAMYIDGASGHVQWEGVGPYTDENKILAFVEEFPDADMSMLKKVVPAKKRLAEKFLSGEVYFTVNNQRQARSDADNERTRREMEVWAAIGDRLGV